MKRIAIFALVMSLLPYQAFAQSLQDSIRRTVVKATLEEAQAQAQSEDGGIPPGFLWTGISLLGAGGLYMALSPSAGDVCSGYLQSQYCDDSLNTQIFVFGAALAGAGAALLIIGKNKGNRASPELAATPGGVVLRGRITLGRLSTSK